MSMKCACGRYIDPGDEAIGRCKVCRDNDNTNKQNQQYLIDSYNSTIDMLIKDATRISDEINSLNVGRSREYER